MQKIISILFVFFLSYNVMGQTPFFSWVDQVNCSYVSGGKSVAVDGTGNVYTLGIFNDTVDVDPGIGTCTFVATPSYPDIFITKVDAAGNFVWGKQLPGVGYDYGTSIIIDPSGNILISGTFELTIDVDPGSSTYTFAPGTNYLANSFILKLSSSGNFLWAKQFKGNSYTWLREIVLDVSGNIYGAGDFMLTSDFDPGASTYNLSSTGGQDIFMTKLDASGNFIWAKQIGGLNTDLPRGCAVDASSNFYVTGYYSYTADFDPGPGTVNLPPSGNTDAFAIKLNSNGNYVWAKNWGGTQGEEGSSIKVDASGNVLIAGFYVGLVDFDPSPWTYNITALGGGQDTYILKLDASGNIVWVRTFDGTGSDECHSLFIDNAGDLYTTGFLNGTTDYDPGAGVYNLSSLNASPFISKLNSLGNFVWAVSLSTKNSWSIGNSVVVDPSLNVYTTGYNSDTCDYDPGIGTYTLAGGSGSSYTHKMSQSPLINKEVLDLKNELLEVYPNPFTNKIHVKNLKGDEPYELLNSVGQIIWSGKNIEQKDLSELNSGIYFLKVKNDNSNSIVKLVKQ